MYLRHRRIPVRLYHDPGLELLRHQGLGIPVRRQIHPGLYFNGLLVTDAFLDELEKRNIHTSIQFSFDGVGHHDWMRGVPGAEKVVIDAFKRCKVRGISTSASMAMCRESAPSIRETVRLLASLGCSSLKINNTTPQGEWLNEPEHYVQIKYDGCSGNFGEDCAE